MRVILAIILLPLAIAAVFGIIGGLTAIIGGVAGNFTRPKAGFEECVAELKKQENPWKGIATIDYEGTCRSKGYKPR